MKVEEYESLFKFSGDDFEVWKSNQNELPYYNLSVEGYIGYEEIEAFIDLYSSFLEKFREYLKENHPNVETATSTWKTIYQTRGVEICKESGYYFIFMESYESTRIWDIYDFMKDVIEQIRLFAEQNKFKR